MSSTKKKELHKKSKKTSNLVDDFFSNKDNTDEPLPKKVKLKEKSSIEEDPDDSLKLFKSLRVYKAKPASNSTVSQPSTSNLATKFIDESSKISSQSSSIRSLPKTTNKRTKRKPKTQPDIRKVWGKQEQVFNHIVSEQCIAEGLDPEEMQLAMAISESLNDQPVLPSADESSTSSSIAASNKFENPFASTGKVIAIGSMLERFGFKSKKNYSEYEIDMMVNSKVNKRSKFQKFPTALTRMTNEKREENIRKKVDEFLHLNQSTCLVDFGGKSRHDYKVFSYNLQELQEDARTIFAINSEDRPTNEVLLSYYVTELFEPSFVKADHLLKDWSKIQGRDPTPERYIEKVSENDENATEVSQKTIVISSNEIVDGSEEIKVSQIDTGNESETSCQDIFADIEDFEMDSYNLGTDSNSCELGNHLELLHEKFSQSMTRVEEIERRDDIESEDTVINIQSSDELMESIEETEQVDLTQDSSNDAVQLKHQENKLDSVDVPQSELNKKNSSASQVNSTKDLSEKSVESDATIPFDDSYYSLQQHLKNCQSFQESTTLNENPLPQTSKQQETLVQISLISSDEDTSTTQTHEIVGVDEKVEDESDRVASQNSLNDDECFEISDEEVNYSMRKYQNESASDKSSDAASSNNETVDLTQKNIESDLVEPYPIEVDNLVEESLVDVMIVDNNNINDTISNLLENSLITYTPMASKKDRSFKVNESIGLSDSIKDIMKRYGITTEAKVETPRSFKKMQSDSQLVRRTVRFSIEDEDDIVDLTQQILDEDESLKENTFQNNNFNTSIHQSFENIVSYSPAKLPRKQNSRATAKRSLGVQIDDNFIVNTETFIPEPDFKNMTPVELKQELSKYGIRSLPVKKAIALLEHIYDQLYPKIRVAADEEIDMNDTRRIMNITDIVTNIEMQDDDDFVFQCGLIEDEEITLPKMKKSKVHSCAIPLHISFYNMVRSNEKIQKFILEFRPVELDHIYKHFRKFGLSYEMNDIISFLDRRCITFKTREKSYSKTHERKKKKRGQKATQSQN